ncbi:hypothetical protein F4604DRAFT_1687402 [Suillus subluteus]|nr:hypothetical protein F4604DRAFT_1687402 [Suillus subluteus]
MSASMSLPPLRTMVMSLSIDLWDALTAASEKALAGMEDSPDNYLPVEEIKEIFMQVTLMRNNKNCRRVRFHSAAGKDGLAVYLYRIDPDASNPTLQDLIDGRWTLIPVDGQTHVTVSGD